MESISSPPLAFGILIADVTAAGFIVPGFPGMGTLFLLAMYLLAIMRADSGRRYFFRPVTVRHRDIAQATVFCIRLYDCTFPERGVYFVELWYDDQWVVDQRLELT
jgi:hypothetical protein